MNMKFWVIMLFGISAMTSGMAVIMRGIIITDKEMVSLKTREEL